LIAGSRIGATIFFLMIAAFPLSAQAVVNDDYVTGATSPVTADPEPLPPRPTLLPGADTNSAQQYFQAGMDLVWRQPEQAAHAFFWASRIDPSSGDALYGLYAATVLAMPEKELQSYLHLGKEKRPEKYPTLDSMAFRAYAMNPFVFGSLDPAIMHRTLAAGIRYAHPQATDQQVSLAIFGIMGGPSNLAWLQFSENQLPSALETYAKVLADTAKPPLAKAKDSVLVRKHRETLNAEIHMQRGRIFYLLDNMDSAATEMNAALVGLQQHDEDDKNQTFFYRSKAMFQQSLGMIYQRANKLDMARQAYGRALVEDLSFYAAHTRLAQLDLAGHDTAGAIAEMDLAAQLNPNDAVVQYTYADILVHAKHDAEAVAHLKKAIALDPYYGAPHLLLALIADVEQYRDDAIAEYAAFVKVASRKDEHLRTAQARLKELTSTVASNQPKE
jgi:tetratricopeptide (TPR) repeat protein